MTDARIQRVGNIGCGVILTECIDRRPRQLHEVALACITEHKHQLGGSSRQQGNDRLEDFPLGGGEVWRGQLTQSV
jgi:hypothetical protein